MQLVSILMCVYNDESYLAGAIESILNQSYTHFEFIIVNDCSTDNSENIILQYKDPRIVYLKNSHNSGLAVSLNNGLNIAKGDYIARMDSDDTAFPLRLEKQVAFMNKHPDVILSGAWIKFFGDAQGTWKTETKHAYISARLLLNTPLAHPTWILRKELISDHRFRYDENLRRGQDYDFLYRVSKVSKLASMPEIILNYRVKHSTWSTPNHTLALQTIRNVRNRIFNDLNLAYSEEEYALHSLLGEGNYSQIKDGILLKKWLVKLLDSNNKAKVFDTFVFKTLMGEIWLKYHFFNKKYLQIISSPRLLSGSFAFTLKKLISRSN